MSLLADALQPYMTNGLISLGGRIQSVSLPELVTRRGAAYDLDVDAQNEAIVLDFRDPRLILEAVASDFCRLASASFQTLSEITSEVENKNALPWALIKLYYSAFYAGHAVIRLLGESCSYFAVAHVRRLNETAALLNKETPFILNAGFYQCVFNSTSSGMTCKKTRGLVGGAHESFWNMFGSKLQNLSTAVLSGSLSRQDAQAVFVQIESLRDLIRPQRGHSWLSAVRNEVQYRYQYGVWFPPEHKRADRDALGRLASQWKLDPMKLNLSVRSADLDAFVLACVFIVAFCRAMLLRVADRSTSVSRAFVEFGPMMLLRHMKAA
jgi:hypothetical protein